jgi:FkbM family methyltransferase
MQFERFQRKRSLQSISSAPLSRIHFLGAEFELHPTNKGLSEELVMYGSHEPIATSAYVEALAPGGHVIEIGANIGYWLLLASRKVGDTGQVMAFEPVPSNLEILKRNIERSGQKNIDVYPWAIGAEAGAAQFYQSQIPNWGSLIQDSRLLPSGSYPVPVKTLDDVLKEFPKMRPTALRMDVEGAELMVLRGAKDLLKRFRPLLFIEFHPFILGWPAIRDMLNDLRDVGYISGILIERTWDHPWISKWVRDRRCWSGQIGDLVAKIESPKDLMVESTFSIILHGADVSGEISDQRRLDSRDAERADLEGSRVSLYQQTAPREP